jgi:prophage tail gpP-like protein
MAVADLGCRGKRKYCLYVRMTQDKADDSSRTSRALLESDEIARHYPEHAKRKVGKFGNAKGWRRNRVWTAGGFAVDAIGLDTASRGVKLEDQRPDLIIFDDIDDLQMGRRRRRRRSTRSRSRSCPPARTTSRCCSSRT